MAKKKWLKDLRVNEYVNDGTGFISFECPTPTNILISLIPPQGKLLFVGIEPDKNRSKFVEEEFCTYKFSYKEFTCKSPPWLKKLESVWGFILTVDYEKVKDDENIEFFDYSPYGGYWFIFNNYEEINSELLIDTLNSKESMLTGKPWCEWISSVLKNLKCKCIASADVDGSAISLICNISDVHSYKDIIEKIGK